jgi:hypothetical protein
MDKIETLSEKLEESTLKRDIASAQSEEAELKAVEHEARARYGPDWKKILGYLGVRGGAGTRLSALYAIDPSLRELAIPRARRR